MMTVKQKIQNLKDQGIKIWPELESALFEWLEEYPNNNTYFHQCPICLHAFYCSLNEEYYCDGYHYCKNLIKRYGNNRLRDHHIGHKGTDVHNENIMTSKIILGNVDHSIQYIRS